MISNQNVPRSVERGRNVFANSYFAENVEGNTNLHLDVHPLFGYTDRAASYLWSYGFYLSSPFMFRMFKEETPDSEERSAPLPPPGEEILYYLVYEGDPNDPLYANRLREKLRQDMTMLVRMFDLRLTVCSWCDCPILEAEFPIIRDFDLVERIVSSAFVVCNAPSRLFWLAYECGRNVCCIDLHDPYMLLSLIHI